MGPEMMLQLDKAICKVAEEIELNNLHQASDTKLIEALAKLVTARALIELFA